MGKIIKLTKDLVSVLDKTSLRANFLGIKQKGLCQELYFFNPGYIIKPFDTGFALYPQKDVEGKKWRISKRKGFRKPACRYNSERAIFELKDRSYLEVKPNKISNIFAIELPYETSFIMRENGNNSLKNAFGFCARQLRTDIALSKKDKKRLGIYFFKTLKNKLD